MKNIVVTYTEDDYECGIKEKVFCVRYESPEAFIKDFEAKLIFSKQKNEESIQLRNDWVNSQPKLKTSGRKKVLEQKAAYDKEIEAWQARKPMLDHPSIDIGGHTFYAWDFCKYNHDGSMASYVIPDAFELNDWFELNVK